VGTFTRSLEVVVGRRKEDDYISKAYGQERGKIWRKDMIAEEVFPLISRVLP